MVMSTTAEGEGESFYIVVFSTHLHRPAGKREVTRPAILGQEGSRRKIAVYRIDEVRTHLSRRVVGPTGGTQQAPG